MRAVQVSRPSGPLELVDRDVPDPGAGEVRIRVEACGICHSDSLTEEGSLPGLLIAGRRAIKGWYSGTAADSEDTLGFSVQAGVRSMNEVLPLERAAEAYERRMRGEARFRVVLATGR